MADTGGGSYPRFGMMSPRDRGAWPPLIGLAFWSWKGTREKTGEYARRQVACGCGWRSRKSRNRVTLRLCASHHSTCTSLHSGGRPGGAGNSTYKGPRRTRQLEPSTGGKTFRRLYHTNKGQCSLPRGRTYNGTACCPRTTYSSPGEYKFSRRRERLGSGPFGSLRD